MHAFQPVRVGNLSLPNRLVMAPVKTGFADADGLVTPRLVAYYRRRAEGGVAAIVVEPLYVDRAGKEHPRQLGVDRPETVEGLRHLVDVLHDAGALAIANLNHAGRAANPKAAGRDPEAPSAVLCPTTGATPEALERERIHELVRAFADGARRAREARFDAVEIQCGLGYLVAQFLSPRTNQRDDEYGRRHEEGERFAREVIAALRQSLDDEIPLQARISATEHVDGGLDPASAKRFARHLVDWGVSALHVVTGSACDTPPWYYQHMSLPDGLNEQLAADLKSEVSVPVVVAGRLGQPERIEAVLGSGQADLVALGRPLVADPDLPRKMAEGRTDEIVLCGSCLQGCLANVKAGKGIGCIVNPEVGREGEPETPAGPAHRVVVVGGGPAGLTAAIVARRRGHRVTLLEREELGGQFTLAPVSPGKAAMARPLDSLLHLVACSGADIRTGVEATADLVRDLDPDVVVLATGAQPIRLTVPGLEHAPSGNDVLARRAETGKHVLIVGGGLVGIEVAEFLAGEERQVTVVEMLSDIARDMEAITRKMTLARLQKLQVEILTETTVVGFASGVAVVRGPGGEREVGPYDSVVVAVGTRPDDALAAPLRDLGLEVVVVGDAGRLEQIQGAVVSAWEATRGT